MNPLLKILENFDINKAFNKEKYMYGSSPIFVHGSMCPEHSKQLVPQKIEVEETILTCPEPSCNYSYQKETDTFNITLREAKALLKLISSEYIPHEPYEDYEQIMRLINGLGNFIDSHGK